MDLMPARRKDLRETVQGTVSFFVVWVVLVAYKVGMLGHRWGATEGESGGGLQRAVRAVAADSARILILYLKLVAIQRVLSHMHPS